MTRRSSLVAALIALVCHLSTPGRAGAQGVSASGRTSLSVADATRLTWRLDTRDAGIAALRAILIEVPGDTNARVELGRALTWTPETRAEGIGLLRQALEQAPERLEVEMTLAEVLTWSLDTRAEGIRRLRLVVAREPERNAARVKLADALSWTPSTREQARLLYLRALRDDPHSPEAALGLARVLAWTGHRAEARVWYQAAMANEASSLAARIGIAELENWQGRARASLKTLDAMPDGASETPDALKLRAQAYSQIGRPARAMDQYRKLLKQEPSNPTAVLAVRELRRGLRPTLEVAAEGGTESGDWATSKVEASRVPFRFTFHPGGSDAQLSVSGANATYRNANGSSPDRLLGVGLDTPVGNRTRASIQLVSHEFDRGDRVYTGSGQLQLVPHDVLDVRVGFSRDQLSSSRLSLAGELAGRTFYGPSFVSQITVGVSGKLPFGFDGWMQGTTGRIRGLSIAENQRAELFAGAGRNLQRGKVSVRPGYSLSWMSYDKNLEGFPADSPAGDGVTAPGVGGYFSPKQFINHMARIDATVQVIDALFLSVGAGGGRQRVESLAVGGYAPWTGSSDGYLGVRWNLGEHVSLGTQITYQNVAGSYDRTILRGSFAYGF